MYDKDAGVLFVYLNGLKLRGSRQAGAAEGGEKEEEKEGERESIKRGDSMFKRMVSRVPWGKKK